MSDTEDHKHTNIQQDSAIALLVDNVLFKHLFVEGPWTTNKGRHNVGLGLIEEILYHYAADSRSLLQVLVCKFSKHKYIPLMIARDT